MRNRIVTAAVWLSLLGIGVFGSQRSAKAQDAPPILIPVSGQFLMPDGAPRTDVVSLAIALYDELVHDRDSHTELPSPKKASPPGKVREASSPRPDAFPNETHITKISHKASSLGKAPPEPSAKTVSSSHQTNTATGVSWNTRYTRLVNEI